MTTSSGSSRAARLGAPEAVRLILVRHGETLWNREERWQGHKDIALSDVGLAQADCLAARIESESISTCFASDLCRASETARRLNRENRWSIEIRESLREVCLGPFEGMRTSEIEEELPDAFQRRVLSESDEDIDFALEGMESRRAFVDRAAGAVHACSAGQEGKTILVVAHGGVVRAFFIAAFGLEYASARQVEIPNCAFNSFRSYGGRWRLETWADVSHLGEMVTRAS